MDISSYSLVTHEGQVDNGRSREEELIHMALSNPLIRDQIVMNVDVKEILKCRLINSNWDDTVTSLVSRSKVTLPAISFKFTLLQDGSFGYKSTEGHGDLMDFTKLFISSSNFPYNNFSFQNGPLMTSDMKNFLAHFGHHVKILSLDMSASDHRMNLPYTVVENLRRFLIKGVPNVESLALNSTLGIWHDMTFQLFPTGQTLPRLKTFKLGQVYVNHQNQIILDILVAAVNLEITKGINPRTLHHIIQANKMNTIKTFCFEAEAAEMEIFHKFISAKPQLQEIGFYFTRIFEDKNIWPQVGHIITKLFKCSQLSLQKIKDFSPVSFLGQSVKIPRLVNVKEITFSELNHSYEFPTMTDHQMFPSGQRLSDLFPNIVKIRFSLHPPRTGQNDLVWESIFRESASLPSVKMLEFDECANKTIMDKFPTLFPNVDHLIIKLTLDDFPSLFGPFWTISPDVKTMEIVITLSLLYKFIYFFPEMDSSMTGISVEKCNQLADKLARLPSKDIENLRTKPSIVNLTKLEYFSMEFNFPGPTWVDPIKPIFSHVTGIHAFQFMKDRQNLVVSLKPSKSSSPLSVTRPLDLVLGYI